MTALEPFSLHDPLPTGRLAIEASAGTGKTYALASLAARYVAEEGIPIGELLVVTFTRTAAAELKDRVRARLVEFADLLDYTEIPEDLATDAVAAAVWDRDGSVRALRSERVRAAITDFDSATITTIHGFAQQILGTLGSAVLADPDAVLLDDASSIVAQVATDLLVGEAVRADHDLDDVPDLNALCVAASLAIGNPGARLVPNADDDVLPAATRLRGLVDQVVAEVDRRRRAAATQSFDDLLVRLRDAIADDTFGPAAREAIQSRYCVSLIDEFQDTDPVQWSIFDAVFGHLASGDRGAGTALVLVGDPKQAIYAFRGANVHTYLQAAHAPGTDRRNLDTNWRSDPRVLEATEVLLSGATFGDAGIGFQRVAVAEKNKGRAFVTADGTPLPALSLRLVDAHDVPRVKKGDTRFAHGDGAAVTFDEMGSYLRDLLERAHIPDPASDDPGATRPLRPDDIAVLVSANYEAVEIRKALGRMGIPAVISRGDNVLTSEAAGHWHRLLAAVARPTDPRAARAAALSWFGGRDAGWVAAASDADLVELQERLHRWGEHLNAHGVAGFIGLLRSETGVAERVLAREDGDRSMTDVDHIAELLVIAGGRRPSPTSLLALYEQLSGGNDDGDPEADLAARRVESEARAVQIMTTFVAKGLEFPVVCCPSLWRPRGAKADHNVWWDHKDSTRVIDVASKLEWGDADARAERTRAAAAEAVGTNLRVLYVALTRACHHLAVWWLPTGDAPITGLARVLFARGEDGQIDPEAFTADEVDVPFGEDAVAALEPLVARGGGTLDVALVGLSTIDRRRWARPDDRVDDDLVVASLGRTLPRDCARWSFTSITALGGGHHAVLDPTDATLGDGRSADEHDVDGAAADPDIVVGHGIDLPLGDIAGGAGFGNLVHKVFEVADFTAADLAAELGDAVDASLRWNRWPVDPGLLVEGLEAVLRTPLGPLFDGRALCELPRTDRLDELTFDLTLGMAGSIPSDADVGRVLLEQLDPDDPLRPWAEHLASGPFGARLAGHLTGSIDLVARIHRAGTPDRFVVCDYKSNRLAARGVTPTSWHFEPDQLVAAMADADYPLQALLYSVALHRYLRWRVADYDPGVHLGGVGYLFLRGMVGPDTPVHGGAPDGLFEWHPPAAAIRALSDLLDGRPRRPGGGS
ncbi:MAG: hypothetical protein EXQ71_09015 [Acidimicrobiia bacterium]|nr:hypothetical protein [Acidimicrobiia bacterium]